MIYEDQNHLHHLGMLVFLELVFLELLLWLCHPLVLLHLDFLVFLELLLWLYLLELVLLELLLWLK